MSVSWRRWPSTQSRQERNRLTSIVSRTSECPLSCSPWEISLTSLPPRSLPVALRPYPDEGLGSWLSRTGAIYGCTAGELLSQFVKSEREPFDQIDLRPPGSLLSHIGVMLSTTAFNLEKCTLAQAHPEWLVQWISRTQPLWHITDHCTLDRLTVLPAVCPLCLSDDLRAGHSQYLRLAWYCSILTICQVHRTPMVTCCSAEVWHHRFTTRAGMPIPRSCCLACRRHLDGPQSWGHTSINLRSRLCCSLNPCCAMRSPNGGRQMRLSLASRS